MKRIIAVVLILAGTTAESLADGKIFWREEIPPDIPYQRALILFRNGTETLVLQSKYEISEAGENTTLGWIVPVPAEPEVASIRADLADYLFMYLSRHSRPRVTRIAPTIFAILFLTVAGMSLLAPLICLVSFVVPFPQWFKRNRGRLVGYSIWGLLLCFVMAIVLPGLASAGGSLGVDVIAEHRAGIYDVSVVRSDDVDDLVVWLNKHDFKFGDKDTAAFESYVSRGWCFVVAMINPSADQTEEEIVSEGLVAPLILRFPHSQPVYPVALTGTGDFETEILIYLASATKMTCNDRLTLRFAGEPYEGYLKPLSAETAPHGFFNPKEMNYPYLCKFRDRLTPENMNQDIVFSKAEDDKPFREHIVKW